MKRIAYSVFLAALLSSCGNNYLSGGNGISVRMKSGAQNDYKLLSVRDSSLVVMDANDEANENSFAHAGVIRFDTIYKVYRGYSTTTSRLIGAGLLAGSGLWLAILATRPESNKSGFAAFGPGIIDGWQIGAIAIIGISGIIALAGSHGLQYHPIFAKDKEILRQISTYPDAEPEMLKLVH